MIDDRISLWLKEIEGGGQEVWRPRSWYRRTIAISLERTGTRQVISVGSDDGWIKIHDGRRARGPGRGSSGAPTRSATSINSSSLNSGAMLIPLPPLPLKPSSFELEWNFSRNLCSIMSERSIQPMISSVSSCCTCRSQRRRFQGKRSYRRIVCVRR